MAIQRAHCRWHVDQCQHPTDISTAHYTVRWRGYFSSTATDRNCRRMAEETESTPKRVVRPTTQQAATQKPLAFPGLRAQARESSWDLLAVRRISYHKDLGNKERERCIIGRGYSNSRNEFAHSPHLADAFWLWLTSVFLYWHARSDKSHQLHTYYSNCTYFCPITINNLLFWLHRLNTLFLATGE